ncbi:MAG: transcriptional regulator, partial [Rhizorhabdus sp.]|nr:transcriptional regulator [Rhizorhabdus sp.]
EMAAQGDLVRVLTHEIMNSLTPVTSLARSAVSLLDDDGAAARRDAHMAIDTLARRAEGLSRFVDSYRSFAQTPEVRARRFEAQAWASEIVQLARADPRMADIDLAAEIEAGAMIDGDPDLLAQVIINLLRNAATAAWGARPDPAIRLTIARTRGGRIAIVVADNGPGIPPDRADDVFLPFYTTKADGNGVGLSFARQVVVAHNGLIAVEQAPAGGALFRILI